MSTTAPATEPANFPAPPVYDEAPLLPGEGAPPREEGDNVPDDFKYSTSVAECALSIRHAFIRKVYTILVAQLIGTFAVGLVIRMNDGLRLWAMENLWAFYVSLFGSIGLMIGAFIKQRTYPTNLLFLGGFTLLESYCVGVVSSLYDTNIVIQAVLITLLVFVGITLFAMQTKRDFTSWAGYLYTALWALIMFGFVSMFFPYSSKVELFYSGIGALIFSAYILVDTQYILRRFHPEDEVAAAIALYLDIINLFLNILRILNEIQDNN